MSFKFNPFTGNFDIVNDSSTNYISLIQEFKLKLIAATDKVVSYTILNENQRTHRVSSIIVTSVLYPEIDHTKSISYLDVGSINQRINEIEYTGSFFGSGYFKKVFEYNANKRKTGYHYELV